MKIVVLDGRTLVEEESQWAPLKQLGEVEVYERSTDSEVLDRSRPAGVLITNKARIGAAVMEEARELRFIAVGGTGYDCVDVSAARRHGIGVANVPEYGTDSVAQHTFALLLELCQQVGLHAEAVGRGEWTHSPEFFLQKTPLIELAGKTMGTVGLGRIGRRVSQLAHAFGMQVLVCGRNRTTLPDSPALVWVDLDELFAHADVISLHCPLTPETAGLVNRERLRRVKPSALLLNTSRGGLIVEQDLADALNEERLAGAAVDVVSREPIQPDNPLRGAKHCLITPHIAWATNEARQRLLDGVVGNVAAFLGGKPTNLVS